MNYTNDLSELTYEPDPQARCDAVMKLIWEHAPKTLTIAEAGALAFKIEMLLRNPVGFGVTAESSDAVNLLKQEFNRSMTTDCIGALTSK